MSIKKIILDGILGKNPLFRMALSLCPAVAVTTTVIDGFGMGVSVLFVMVMADLISSMFRKFYNPKVRIPIFVLITATFVSIVEAVVKAYLPALDKSLGIYIPLIVVYTMILARIETFASKQPVHYAVADGIGMGSGFALALVLVGIIRELIGNGTILGYSVFGENFSPMLILILPPGGFIVIGVLMGLFNWFEKKIKKN